MSARTSPISGVSIVCSTVSLDAQIKENIKVPRHLHLWEESIGEQYVDSPHKGSVTRKMFQFDDVIILPWKTLHLHELCVRYVSFDQATIGSNITGCPRGNVCMWEQTARPATSTGPATRCCHCRRITRNKIHVQHIRMARIVLCPNICVGFKALRLVWKVFYFNLVHFFQGTMASVNRSKLSYCFSKCIEIHLIYVQCLMS